MPLQNFGKILIIIGVIVIVAGVLVFLGGKAGLGSLPGDMSWKRGNTSVYFPIVTSSVLSIVLTIVVNILMRFFR